MLEGLNLGNVLFLDIETVPLYSNYQETTPDFKKFWDKKAGLLSRSQEETPESLYSRAGIYAEFGKIVCISVGYSTLIDGISTFSIRSFSGDDEKKLLVDFIELLNKHFNKRDNLLCAHNGKEFDFPYIARRILINCLTLPVMLDFAGKKPWEIPHLDTMELWKFGDYKSYTSLDLLASLFNIPTPKDDIDGSDIHRVYWQEKDLDRIVTYCQKDVLTVARVLYKFIGKPFISEDEVVII